jgi:xylulokinase
MTGGLPLEPAIKGALELANVSAKQVLGIGLSGQMHGLVALDSAGSVIRPALIWCDQRSQPQVDAINALVGKESVVACIANPVLTGFTLPKLLWIRDHEPAKFENVKKVSAAEGLHPLQAHRRTGNRCVGCFRHRLFNVVDRRWSLELADRLGIDAGLLPAVLESAEVSGKVSRTGAAATGLVEGTPVVAGAGDQAASAVG